MGRRVSHRSPSLLHRLEFGLYRGAEMLLSKLSVDDCLRLGRGIGNLLHACAPRYRRLVRRNLRIATANEALGDDDLNQLVAETFRRGAANFLGTLRTEFSSDDELQQRIRAEGMELLNQPKGSEQGLLVAMPHMGNWEALTRLGSRFSPDRQYGGVYRPLENPLMDTLTRQRRTAGGAQLFSRKDGFHPPAALLREGGALVVLADQRAGASGEVLPFFGKLTSCSPLPQLLARRSKSRVASLSIRNSIDGTWTLRMLPVTKAASTPHIMETLENAMRESLPDVFWFHDRWRTDSARPLSFFTKIPEEAKEKATVPLRILLTTPEGTPADQVRSLLERMLQLRPDLRLEYLSKSAIDQDDPRIAFHRWDPTTPPEQCSGLLERIDALHPAPLDGGLLFGNEVPLAKAAKRMGLRAIIGLGVHGKPWTQSYPKPQSIAEWIKTAEKLAWIPSRRRTT